MRQTGLDVWLRKQEVRLHDKEGISAVEVETWERFQRITQFTTTFLYFFFSTPNLYAIGM